MLRWLTSGESHGPALAGILEGLPAGVEVDSTQIKDALARRRLGYGRGARMNFEQDELEIIGGIRHGRTQGGPIALRIGNTEWPRWSEVMAADPADEQGRRYDEPGRLPARGRSAPLTRPRPGHADLTGMQKYGFDDARPVLERASARETATRVALGEVARAFLAQTVGAEVVSHVVSLGTVEAPAGVVPGRGQRAAIDADPVRCVDADASARMVAEVDKAHAEGDTLGGVVEVVVHDLPPGLGSYVHWDRKLDARLAAVLMGIQAIKGVEVGDGFETARRRGSAAHDEIERVEGEDGFTVRRRTDRAGGIEGGMSNGEVLRVRAAMKPISTVPRALDTVDTASGGAAQAIAQRSDVCAVPAAGVVAEAMVALVLADAVLEKFGGDNVEQVRANVRSYLDGLSVKVAETP
ncbi:chorismate synthase [Kineococcus sp. SYSU DK003]|uniref:chorismate synthase n=1 Tax=Kineococcus sp. SYSU DK003 TaxID=3383124 RepID=UPI003D7D6BC1